MRKSQVFMNVMTLFAVLVSVVFISCGALFENESSGNVTINLPPVSSQARAISSDKIGGLKNATASYRVHMNDIVREGTGGNFSAYFTVGMKVDIYVECLNSNRDVIVRTITKSITVVSSGNSISFNLMADGNEITPPAPPAPQPVTGRVTYNGNGADSGTPNDTQTYETGSEVTLQAGEPTRAGYTFEGWTSNVALEATDASGGPVQITQSTAFASTSSTAQGVTTKIANFKMPEGGVVLTAQWTELATLYVSASGSNTNSGTAASPLTITKAFEVASAYTSGNETTIEVQDSITGVAVVLTGGKVKLKLNNHTLTGNGTAAVIDITGGSLTLEDNGSGKISGGNRGVKVGAGAKFTMNSGEISVNNSTDSGAGVYVNSNATFNMTGGKINNNTSNKNAGGVFAGGIFTMSGGEITDNKIITASGDGGGVYIGSNSSFEMSGTAVISNNTAASAGGVYVAGTATFIMSGGEIKENKTTSTASDEGLGAGVYVHGTFEMSNSAVISNNTASRNGGGVFVSSTGTFTMSGGEIKENETTGTASSDAGNGGGVYVNNGTFEMSGSAVISNNTASRNGGGVILWGTFTMNDGTIMNNKAKLNGGGVYVAYDASSTAAGAFGGTGGSLSGNKASYDSTQTNGGSNVKDSDYYLENGGKFTNTSSDRTNWTQEN